jgi:hypothetical protein
MVNGVEYDVSVTTVSYGPVQSANSSNPVTATPCTIPDAPIVLAAFLAGPDNDDVQAQWSLPLNGGCVFTGFNVELRAVINNTLSNSVTVSNTTSSYTFAAPVLGRSYQVREATGR